MNIKSKQKPPLTGRGSDFIIRVKSGHTISLQGKIEHIQSGQVQYFNDFLELILLIQAKLDEKGYPQCDTEIRSFIDNN
ncbi:MAG: hypothetical protein ACQESO_03500 [Bacillota bacterium]